MKTVLAGDLGGTKCRIALVDTECGVHCVQTFATVRDRESFLAQLVEAVAGVLAARPAGLEAPTALGLGVAGVARPDASTVDYAPNLPLEGFDLGAHLKGRLGLPVTLLNDGRASAWGEFRKGYAIGADPLLCLFFGTGIGIGILVAGLPYRGATNAAGEVGHTIHVPNGRLCPCGSAGHFEAYCGGRAIVERARAEVGPGPGPGGSWTVGALAQHAATAAGRGGPAATILADAELAASVLTTNLCTLWNPAAVVLGGGVVQGWPELAERIAAFVRKSTKSPIHRELRFVRSLGDSDAILWGAAAATGALWQDAAARR